MGVVQDDVCGRPGDLYPQKENARGERAFSVVNLGVVGVLIIHEATLGGYKEPREFVNSFVSVRPNFLNW